MKNIKSIALATFMSAFLFISCSSDSGDNDSTKASTGDYWPTAIGNEWTLSQDGSESTMKIVSSENIKGDTYFKFNQFAGLSASGEISATATVAIKKVQGDYYVKSDPISYEYEGFTMKISGFEYILFKDYLDVNKTWKGSFTQQTTVTMPNVPSVKMTVNYTGTILERDATVVVNGVTYKDVIKFKLRQDAKVEGETSSVESEYWVAKDIGVVKMSIGDIVSILKSYIIKK